MQENYAYMGNISISNYQKANKTQQPQGSSKKYSVTSLYAD